MQLTARGVRTAVIGTLSTAAVAAAAAPAGAAPTGDYADFTNCPVNAPGVENCLVSDTTSGSIKLGNQTVPINKRIRLQGGVTFDPDTFASGFVPATNGKTLDAPALNVPGGLLGITVPSALPQPARGLLEAAINTVNGVKAKTELAGNVEFDFQALLDGSKPTIVLPIRVKLENPFLGDNCYIGSTASPIRLRLTNGTTAPPAGVAPITGVPGDIVAIGNDVTAVQGQTLVDNTFSVPKASGCGGVLSLLVNPVVNLKIGLPAAPGASVARFSGTAKLAPTASVAASDH